MPTSAASLARTSANTISGTRPTALKPRAERSRTRTWSTRITPLTARPSGKATLVGQGCSFELIGQTMAVSFRRWNSRSVSTTAGRTPPCSRPRVGLRSTHTRSPARSRDKSSAVVVIDDFRPHVRAPIDKLGPTFWSQTIHLGEKLFQRVVGSPNHLLQTQFAPLDHHVHLSAGAQAGRLERRLRQTHGGAVAPFRNFRLHDTLGYTTYIPTGILSTTSPPARG